MVFAAGSHSGPAAGTFTPMADTVTVTLEVPAEVRAGASVPFTVRLRNTSGRRLTLYLQGRQIAFDVAVMTDAGRPVWSRLDGTAVQGILRLEELDAGGEIVLRAEWDQLARGRRAARGEYQAVARVLTDGAPLESTAVRFRLSR